MWPLRFAATAAAARAATRASLARGRVHMPGAAVIPPAQPSVVSQSVFSARSAPNHSRRTCLFPSPLSWTPRAAQCAHAFVLPPTVAAPLPSARHGPSARPRGFTASASSLDPPQFDSAAPGVSLRRRKRAAARDKNAEWSEDAPPFADEAIEDEPPTHRRRNRWKGKPTRCFAVNTAPMYDMLALQLFLQRQGIVLTTFEDVFHVRYASTFSPDDVALLTRVKMSHGDELPDGDRHVYFFSDGTLVCWGTTIEEEQEWIRIVEPFAQQGSVHVPRGASTEEMLVYRGTYSGVSSDTIILADSEDERTLVKHQLAFSFALVRSLLLENLEVLLEQSLERMKDVPSQLESGRLPSTKVWRKIIGEHLKIRGLLNLHSDLLETPDMYWEEPKLEVLFDRMASNLDIATRINIVNKRLDYTQEVTEVVRTYTTDQASHTLEKIIIVLIAIEVMFYVADKSEWWRELTWESVLGIDMREDAANE